MSLYLGLDAGGSSIKGVLADRDGQVLAMQRIPYETMHPATGWAEQDAEYWWEATRSILGHFVEKCPSMKTELAGIMVSGMVPNLVPVDEDGQVVRPAILYRDNRAVDECKMLQERFGLHFLMQDVIPKWIWLRDHEPEHFKRTRLLLGTHAFLAYRLTGNPNIDADTAGLYGHSSFDAESGWNETLFRKLNLPASVLPPHYLPTEAVGYVREQWKKEFGIEGDIPVYAGAGDSLAAILGTGAVHKGDGMIYLGTAATMWVLEEELSHMARKLIFGSNRLHFVSNVLAGGDSVKWVQALMQISDAELEALEEAARRIPAGSDGLMFLPHLLGIRTPVPNAMARGSVLGLSAGHTPAHFYRALLEGVAYSLYQGYEASHRKAERLLITGGGAQCSLWRDIVANVFRLPVEYYEKSDGALGLAYFAAYAREDFSDFSRLESWLGSSITVMPDSANSECYKREYARYGQLDQAMMESYPILVQEE